MKLEVVVTDVSQCQKELAIEVSAAEVKAEFEKAYDAYTRYAKVPGFRPGRVPRGVVKQRFSKEAKDDVVGQLLPHALQHAITDNKLRVIGEPRINDFSVSEGEPLKFSVSVEVLPSFEVQEYKGLKATKQVARVADEDVDNVLQRWRESSAELVPVEDRAAQSGDFVTINLTGKYLDPQGPHEEEGITANDLQIELGAEGVQPEFNDNLQNVKEGDVREFRVSYPADFSSPGLAGKTVDFSATVLSVKQKELPELDDDFAQEAGNYENLQDMRAKVRENLEQEANQRAESRLRDNLLEQILSQYDFEVPPSLTEQQAEDRTRELAMLMLRSGASPQVIREMNWQEQLKLARESAVRDVRAALVVARIGDAEGVSVTDEEVDAEIEKMAAARNESAEQLKARLTKEEAVSSIENRLRYQKAMNAVVNHAEVTTVEISATEEAELMRPAPTPAEETQPASEAAEAASAEQAG